MRGITHAVWRRQRVAGAAACTLVSWTVAEAFRRYLHANAGREQHLRCLSSSMVRNFLYLKVKS